MNMIAAFSITPLRLDESAGPSMAGAVRPVRAGGLSNVTNDTVTNAPRGGPGGPGAAAGMDGRTMSPPVGHQHSAWGATGGLAGRLAKRAGHAGHEKTQLR